jgi:hypothetical protein
LGGLFIGGDGCPELIGPLKWLVTS